MGCNISCFSWHHSPTVRLSHTPFWFPSSVTWHIPLTVTSHIPPSCGLPPPPTKHLLDLSSWTLWVPFLDNRPSFKPSSLTQHFKSASSTLTPNPSCSTQGNYWLLTSGRCSAHSNTHCCPLGSKPHNMHGLFSGSSLWCRLDKGHLGKQRGSCDSIEQDLVALLHNYMQRDTCGPNLEYNLKWVSQNLKCEIWTVNCELTNDEIWY